MGAPTVANGTAPAMDQGIIGATSTAEFSRSRAIAAGIGFQLAAELVRQHDGQSLVAGNHGGTNRSQQNSAKRRDPFSKL